MLSADSLYLSIQEVYFMGKEYIRYMNNDLFLIL